MNKNVTKKLLTVFGVAIAVAAAAFLLYPLRSAQLSSPPVLNNTQKKDIAAEPKLSRVEKKAARSEYFFKLLRDPATNRIPPNVRNQELEFAKTLPSAKQAYRRAKSQNPGLQAMNYNWQQAGPFDVGGRTRALAVDRRNPNIVLAGGVSGGMWKSTDGGQTWRLTTPNLPNLSVTSVAQDPTNPDTWYYASGEVLGNSASARHSAPYYGQGIYKSTDNGDSWSLMPQASSNVQGLVDTYNTVSRIRLSPTTGTIFISSIGRGIYRSTDGQSFSDQPVLGTEGEQIFCDVAVASDGTIAAVISEAAFDDQGSRDSNHNHNPGVFVSNDDGKSWTEITPDTFPQTHMRSVLSFAPSNPDILYVFTKKGVNNTTTQGVSFHHIDLASGTADDRSANLPDFRVDGEGTGYVNTQNGYNMMVSVKPDNENYVFIGATNLFRSSNGFKEAPAGGYDGNDETQKDRYWIGGYNQDNSSSTYPNQHPDQHIVAFPQPSSNPDIMWAGHDGGLSYTSDVSASEVSWENRDDGYITSQFYAVDLPDGTDDNRLLGGTQDNGSPYFRYNSGNQQESATIDVSSGDGGYSYWGTNYAFVSSQNGRVLRLGTEADGGLTSPFDGSTSTDWSTVHPANAKNQLFIHPYVVDPNDENVMYYPENNFIWRNTRIDQIPKYNTGGATAGWEELQNINVGNQHVITAMEVSQNPANVLYLGGSSNNAAPELRRVLNARTATDGAVDISLPSEYQQNLEGAYVKDIAVNPANANEIIVVLSNYGITGLYHSIDGGNSWQAIEGNLATSDSNPGVSLRSASIIPAESGTIYFLGTSTGLYSTQLLDGGNTTWGQEEAAGLGHVVTAHLSSRLSDGDIAVGTHGRGIFRGDFQGKTNAPYIVSNPSEGKAGQTVTLTANDFEFNTKPSANTVRFGDVEAKVLNATSSKLEVRIPRGVIGRQAPSRSVIVTVETGEESLSTNFKILPPNEFALTPNYPNPFNPSTTIPFDLPAESEVTLSIYNINGQKVLEPLDQEVFNAGTYNHTVDLSGLASGVYIYRIYVKAVSGEDDAMQSRKMTLIK